MQCTLITALIRIIFNELRVPTYIINYLFEVSYNASIPSKLQYEQPREMSPEVTKNIYLFTIHSLDFEYKFKYIYIIESSELKDSNSVLPSLSGLR